MEALSTNLKPYKSAVGGIATVVTIAQLFSGAFVCNDIYKKKTTRGMSSMPFVGSVILGILMLKYSVMLQDGAMFTVNVAGIIFNTVYSLFYYVHSEDKHNQVHKPLSYGVALVAIMLSYAAREDPAVVEWRYGFICTTLMLLLMASPLMELNEIIKKEDASSIPFHITVMSTIVSFLWLIYGIIILNNFTVVHNAVGLLICMAQMVLLFMYPKHEEQEKFPEYLQLLGHQTDLYNAYYSSR